jgi:uncharacterized membrane protein
MIEPHPAIVHFPVALLSIAALFAVVSLLVKKEFFKEVAFWTLLLGVIGAIAAVLTGLIEEQNLVHSEEIHKLLVKHKFTGFGILILSFSLLTWVWVRKTKFGKREYILWVLFLVLGTVMIFYQGWVGGRMVFELGAGVKPMEPFLEKAGESGQPHEHSNTGHDHDNAQDTSSAKKYIPQKTRHVHSHSEQDTLRKRDSMQAKEKTKELKDMKY